jgi:ADP-heptose:LPS heptosyltransferase
MELMLVNRGFTSTKNIVFNPGELWIVDDKQRQRFIQTFRDLAVKLEDPRITKSVEFINFDNIIKPLRFNDKFSKLLIIRAGGIGDIIALTSIIDYLFRNTVFVTQEKYFPIFEWFLNKPSEILNFLSPLFKDVKRHQLISGRFSNWRKLASEGPIESGDRRNWMELFFSFIGENNPDKSFLRPQLKAERINQDVSNIQKLSNGKKSLLIVNKASSMIRTCRFVDIYTSLPKRIFDEYQVFYYDSNLSDVEKFLEYNATKIEQTTMETFFLDLFDANQVISVDTGALHFREGVDKPAIGLYNSFTTESRTKYYEYTKSFDIKSECPIAPCFEHGTPEKLFCSKGSSEMFAAPCFSSDYNLTLKSQLSKIFNENL